MKSRAIGLFVLLAAALAAPASAQIFNVMAADANKDGKITLDEAFAGKDKNKDGFVTPQELGIAKSIYMPADADGDGKLSKAEYGAPGSFFATADADKDGALTKAEIMSALGGLRRAR